MTRICTSCGKEFVPKGKKQQLCQRKCGTGFSDSIRDEIIELWGDTPVAEIAKAYNTTEDYLLKVVVKWRLSGIKRKDGTDIPRLLKNYGVAIGAIVNRRCNGRDRLYRKTATGWEYVQSGYHSTSSIHQRDTRDYSTRILPNREIDLSTKQRVYIPELRMHVYTNPGQSVEEVKAKYIKHRQVELKGHVYAGR